MKVRDGEKYNIMPSLDGMILVDEFEDPAAGKARITLTDTNTGGKRSYAFTEGRKDWWLKRGMPPVVWHYIPPTRERAPQLLIAVDRLTAIEETPPKQKFPTFWVPEPASKQLPKFQSANMGRGGGGCGCHTGHHVSPPRLRDPVVLPNYDGYDPVSLEPKVTIFRVQNPSLMPDLLDPSTIMSSIGEPHIILPGDNAEAIDKNDFDVNGELDFKKLSEHRDRSEIATGILVLPQPQGVVFQALNNWFYLTIEVKDTNRPACFAYKVMPSGATKVFLIEHDGNVKIEVNPVDAESTKPIIVYARRRWKSANVPAQGDPIRFVKDSFKKVDVPDTAKTSLVFATQLVVETLMGFVPVIGDLYQFGQLAYMCATGKDFWGNQVSHAEIIVYGALSLVGSGAPILAAKASARSSFKAIKGAESILGAMQTSNGVAIAAMRQADEVVSRVGGNRLVRELNVLGQTEREKILEPVLDAVTSTQDAAQAGEKAAKLLHEGIAAAKKADQAVANAIDDIRTASILSSDGKNFQNQYLRFEYDKYFNKAGKNGKDPLEWLASGSRNPWVDKYCRTLFGGDYKKVIRGSLKRNSVPGTMTAEHIKHYDKIIGKGVGNYGALAYEAKKVKGFRQFFELDHVIEQRFLKRFRDYTDAVPKGHAFETFLVPKNAAVAAEMIKVAKDSRLITYVHVVKSRMLRQRIPIGAEHLFSVQQIADATLYTLQKLGARDYFDFAYLATDFELLAKAMKQPIPTLKTAAELPEDLFTAAKGWPQVKCDDWGRAIF
jgi:hypothetical protein